MSAEDFNAEYAAKEAIATSPEFTEGVDFGSVDEGLSANQALNGELEGYDYQPDNRNGRLLAIGLQQWDKGDRLQKEQIDAAEEVGSEAFGALKSAPIPAFYKIMVTLALLVFSIVPIVLDIASAYGEKGEEDGIN